MWKILTSRVGVTNVSGARSFGVSTEHAKCLPPKLDPAKRAPATVTSLSVAPVHSARKDAAYREAELRFAPARFPCTLLQPIFGAPKIHAFHGTGSEACSNEFRIDQSRPLKVRFSKVTSPQVSFAHFSTLKARVEKPRAAER